MVGRVAISTGPVHLPRWVVVLHRGHVGGEDGEVCFFLGRGQGRQVNLGVDKGVYERQCLFGKKQACVQLLLRYGVSGSSCIQPVGSLGLMVEFGRDMKGPLEAEYSEIWERGCFNELAGPVWDSGCV